MGDDPLSISLAEALGGQLDLVLEAVSATLWAVDRELVFRFSRGVVPSRHGLSHDRLVGLSLEEYLAPGSPALVERVRQALAGRKVDFSSRRSDGAEFETVVAPLRDPAGEVVGAVGVTIDVTGRNRALRQTEERLRLVVDQLPAFLWTTDRDLCVTELLGAAAQSAALTPIGSSLRDFWGPDDPVAAIAVHERALAGESVDDEATSGGRTLRSHLEPLHDGAGEVIGVIGVAFDVTAERRLQRDLLQAQKLQALGELTGGIAHDFNNMLTVIGGYAEMARAAAGGDPRLERPLQRVVEAAEASANLTRQLLAFSRRQVLQPRRVDLNEVVRRMVTMLRRLLGENVAVEQRLDARLPPVFADPGQIEQVVANLAINAREAMPNGGTLTIETAEAAAQATGELAPGGYVELVVSDDGVGIEPAAQERIFEPFFTTKKTGSGLGLASVYGIVNQSGGSIGVASEPGRGTSFRILLPQAQTDLADDAGATGAEPAAAPRQLSVLLVEDEAAVRELAAAFLAHGGHRVATAAAPGEALALARQERFDAIVSDFLMPEMDGVQLVELLRPLQRDAGIVFTSGWAESRLHGYAGGVPGAVFLPKPFGREELLVALAEALTRASLAVVDSTPVPPGPCRSSADD